MCLACEEGELYFRWAVLQKVAKGEMPDGMTEDDLRAMDLPLPGEIEMAEDENGDLIIRRVEPVKAPSAADKANAFVCDSPDDA